MKINKEKNWWLTGLYIMFALVSCWIFYNAGRNSGDYKLVFTRGNVPYYWQFYKLQESGDSVQTTQLSADAVGDKVCNGKSRYYLTLVVDGRPKKVAPICDNEEVYPGLVESDTSSVYTRYDR